MSIQNESRLVHCWANNHLVATANQYRLIDNLSNRQIFHCYADSNLEAIQQCINFSRSEWEQSS